MAAAAVIITEAGGCVIDTTGQSGFTTITNDKHAIKVGKPQRRKIYIFELEVKAFFAMQLWCYVLVRNKKVRNPVKRVYMCVSMT